MSHRLRNLKRRVKKLKMNRMISRKTRKVRVSTNTGRKAKRNKKTVKRYRFQHLKKKLKALQTKNNYYLSKQRAKEIRQMLNLRQNLRVL